MHAIASLAFSHVRPLVPSTDIHQIRELSASTLLTHPKSTRFSWENYCKIFMWGCNANAQIKTNGVSLPWQIFYPAADTSKTFCLTTTELMPIPHCKRSQQLILGHLPNKWLRSGIRPKPQYQRSREIILHIVILCCDYHKEEEKIEQFITYVSLMAG